MCCSIASSASFIASACGLNTNVLFDCNCFMVMIWIGGQGWVLEDMCFGMSDMHVLHNMTLRKLAFNNLAWEIWNKKFLTSDKKCTKNIPKVHQQIHQKYTKSTQKFTKNTPKVHQKYTKSIPKVQPKVHQKYTKSTAKNAHKNYTTLHSTTQYIHTKSTPRFH